jgi:hypothetical protein
MVRRWRLIGYFPILYNPQLEVPLRGHPPSCLLLCRRQLNDVLIRNAEVDHKLDSLLSTVAALLKHYTPPPEPAPARSGGLASSDFHTGLLTASLTSAAICMSAACAAFVLDKLRR